MPETKFEDVKLLVFIFVIWAICSMKTELLFVALFKIEGRLSECLYTYIELWTLDEVGRGHDLKSSQ